MKQRATASPDPPTLSEPGATPGLRLSEVKEGPRLLSSGSWVRIPPGTPQS